MFDLPLILYPMASPFTPSLPSRYETAPTTSPAAQQRAHCRRSRDSSRKPGFQAQLSQHMESSLKSIVETGFTSERYRVGAPPLQLLPLERREVRDGARIKSAIDEMIPRIEKALEEREITTEDDHDSIKLVHRTIPDDDEPNTDNLTLIIDAMWNDRSNEDWILGRQYPRNLFTKPHHQGYQG